MKNYQVFILLTFLLGGLLACKKDHSSPIIVYTVTTLAGADSAGLLNGAGTAAYFNYPSGLAVDASGNIYVADTYNNMIRKITPAGVVSTLAGSGKEGNANGTGTAASFFLPTGIAVDNSGNVYVADSYNNLIRKITAAGVVTTLAGNDSLGAVNGADTTASFDNPTGVAVDAFGNVYVADWGNSLIRKITAAGIVTTLAGSGSAGYANGSDTLASFNKPKGIAVDVQGNLYVSDWGNSLIRKVTSAGVVSTLAGSYCNPQCGGFANGTGSAAVFNSPVGMTVDASGNVYVADKLNNLIRKITPAGVVTTFAGSGEQGAENGTAAAASFNFPSGVAIDPFGNVYVADTYNNQIRKIAP